MPHRRLFAVIPAAGHSRRMGEPKLLLPLGGKTILARLLDLLQRPDVTDTILVIRGDDHRLAAEVPAERITVVQPEADPPDMKKSVEHALEAVRRQYAPQPNDGWFLLPADHPVLDSDLLDELIDEWDHSDDLILVPTYEGKRGHPTFFRWSLAEAVTNIPADSGLDWLVQAHEEDVVETKVANRAVLFDLDTPQDYEALQRDWQ